MSNENVQRSLYAIIVAVILGAGTYMLNSRDVNTQLSTKVEATSERVGHLEQRVGVINTTLQDLKVSRATTEDSIKDLEKLSDKLESVVQSLNETVIKLEERLPQN